MKNLRLLIATAIVVATIASAKNVSAADRISVGVHNGTETLMGFTVPQTLGSTPYANGQVIRTTLVTIVLVQSPIDSSTTDIFVQNAGTASWTKLSATICGPAAEVGFSIHSTGFSLYGVNCQFTFQKNASGGYEKI